MTPSMETMAPTIIFRMGHSPCLSLGRLASDPTCSHLNVLASGAVCTAREIRSSICFRERMIEAAGFVQMKVVGSSFQCAMYASMCSRSATLLGKCATGSDCFPRMPKKPRNDAEFCVTAGDNHVILGNRSRTFVRVELGSGKRESWDGF